MDADEFTLTVYELMEQEYGQPVHEKLSMTQDQCQQWLRSLFAKRLTLRDAQQTIRTIVSQKDEADPGDMDELLSYI